MGSGPSEVQAAQMESMRFGAGVSVLGVARLDVTGQEGWGPHSQVGGGLAPIPALSWCRNRLGHRAQSSWGSSTVCTGSWERRRVYSLGAVPCSVDGIGSRGPLEKQAVPGQESRSGKARAYRRRGSGGSVRRAPSHLREQPAPTACQAPSRLDGPACTPLVLPLYPHCSGVGRGR